MVRVGVTSKTLMMRPHHCSAFLLMVRFGSLFSIDDD